MTLEQRLDVDVVGVSAPAAHPTPPAPVTDAEGQQDLSLWRRFFNVRTLVSFGFSAAIIVFVFRGLNIDIAQIWTEIRQADPVMFGLALGVYYLGFPLRALRWRILLSNVTSGQHAEARQRSLPGIPRLSEILVLSWFANCVVPAKMGDVYRAYLLKLDAAVSFARTAGTVLAERMIDLIVLFVLLLLSAIGVARIMTSEHLLITEYILAVGVALIGALIAGLLVLRFFGGSVERRLPLRVRGLFGKFQHGILGSFQARQFPSIAAITIVIWATEAGRLFFVTKALGLEIALPVILFAALANSLLTAVPATPGGLGVVEAGVIGFFSLAGVQDTSAASATLLDRAISYWSLIVVGLPLYLLSFRHRR